MNTTEAYWRAMSAHASGAKMMTFDWVQAARYIVEHKVRDASAGLAGDWEWTGGTILSDGRIVPLSETYIYLASNHCEPELQVTLPNGMNETIDCFTTEHPTWQAKTYWPDEALAVLAESASDFLAPNWREAFDQDRMLEGSE